MAFLYNSLGGLPGTLGGAQGLGGVGLGLGGGLGGVLPGAQVSRQSMQFPGAPWGRPSFSGLEQTAWTGAQTQGQVGAGLPAGPWQVDAFQGLQQGAGVRAAPTWQGAAQVQQTTKRKSFGDTWGSLVGGVTAGQTATQWTTQQQLPQLQAQRAQVTQVPQVSTIQQQGTQRWQGATGGVTQGLTGLQGLQGVQGYQGVQGVQGYQGVQGVQNYSGVQGVQSYQGVQGVQGTQQGTQGFQGVQTQSRIPFNGLGGHTADFAATWSGSQVGVQQAGDWSSNVDLGTGYATGQVTSWNTQQQQPSAAKPQWTQEAFAAGQQQWTQDLASAQQQFGKSDPTSDVWDFSKHPISQDVLNMLPGGNQYEMQVDPVTGFPTLKIVQQAQPTTGSGLKDTYAGATGYSSGKTQQQTQWGGQEQVPPSWGAAGLQTGYGAQTQQNFGGQWDQYGQTTGVSYGQGLGGGLAQTATAGFGGVQGGANAGYDDITRNLLFAGRY